MFDAKDAETIMDKASTGVVVAAALGAIAPLAALLLSLIQAKWGKIVAVCIAGAIIFFAVLHFCYSPSRIQISCAQTFLQSGESKLSAELLNEHHYLLGDPANPPPYPFDADEAKHTLSYHSETIRRLKSDFSSEIDSGQRIFTGDAGNDYDSATFAANEINERVVVPLQTAAPKSWDDMKHFQNDIAQQLGEIAKKLDNLAHGVHNGS